MNIKKINKKYFSFYLLLITCYLLLVTTRSAIAQNIVRITAIPPRLEITVKPGEITQDVIKVRNDSDSELAITTEIKDFISDKEGAPIPVDEEVSGNWASSSWLKTSPSKFIIKPGEIKKLDLIIATPENALAGGHYSVVFYKPIPANQNGENTGSRISPQVGTLLYLTLPGDIKEKAFVKKIDIPKFSEYGPIDIETEIENLSDIHIRPKANIKIYNLFNKLSTSLNLSEKNIFPSQSRSYENKWDKKWLFGRYKAQLEGFYGSTGKSLLATVYFWVIPWKIVLLILLVILLIILLVVKNRRDSRSAVPTNAIPRGHAERR